MKRSRAFVFVVAALAAAAAGCGSRGAPVAGAPGSAGGGALEPRLPEGGRPIEMLSWWERVGDADALGALMREHMRRYPSDLIMNAGTGLSGVARKTLRARMLRNDPPDTFQANAGRDLLQWVRINGMDARESKLLPLDDLVPGAAELRRALPPAVLEQVSVDGKLYGIPANVHRLNSVFYSRKVFERFGLSEPKSVDDLRAMGKKLRGSGVSLLALGSHEPWTVSLMVFECLLIAREGPDTYRRYFEGSLKADDPRIVRTLQASLELLDLANPDHETLSWLQAVDMVVRGQAALTVMGDWARVSFNARGLVLGVDYGEIAFPGTEGTFVFTSDAFPLPAAARNPAGARHLLATIGSVEGQRAINAAKGALPARLDVAMPDADPVLKAKQALMQKGPMVLALSGMLPRMFEDDLAAALSEMIAHHDIEPVLQTLRSRYPLLK
jgi:glucose/mannose transport system substrate-binding protein